MNHPSNKEAVPTDAISRLVHAFLHSNLSIILILFSLLIGLAALFVTPREEDPQIVVPLADIHVEFPGHSASEVEQLVATPLERMLYQIDGVEYVYSMSRDDQAIITVRFYVGQDRERSLVKLFKKLQENADAVTPGVRNWVMKPIEIDDVPIVSFAVTGAEGDSHALRRVSEELVERLSTIPQVSRAYVVGGEPRTMSVWLDIERMQAYQTSIDEVLSALAKANQSSPTSIAVRDNSQFQVSIRPQLYQTSDLENTVIGMVEGRPYFLKDVATITDGPEEVTTYVRHGWGPSSDFAVHEHAPGHVLGSEPHASTSSHADPSSSSSQPAVTIAISKQKGANAVRVAENVIREAERLQREVLPDNMQLVVTRNSGLIANEKVNELVEALGVAIIIVILLLTIGLGWREALIVSVAVPVVFGLTLAINWMFGYSINRVTLFALILALGLLVDDPIVDVENIARHFEEKKKATRKIVLAAVAEIRPPLISATLAVIVSFLPMFFITGMMGPYMSPMALNVPVAMLMSMLVAFTITPWLSYQVLKRNFPNDETGVHDDEADESASGHGHANYDPQTVQKTWLYRLFRPMMTVLLKSPQRGLLFLVGMALLTGLAAGLGAMRMVPLKMLPFDNKNELLILLDMPERDSLERTDMAIRRLEEALLLQPEVVNFTSTVGTAGPIDFNGMVRHYYLRRDAHQGEIRVSFVPKKNRKQHSHAIALRIRDQLEEVAKQVGGTLHIVELPPGPPVLASLVAEVTGKLEDPYDHLLASAEMVGKRMAKEPGVAEVDTVRETPPFRHVFVPDQEKAALAGITIDQIDSVIHTALHGDRSQALRVECERHPLLVTLRLPRSQRSDWIDLARLSVKGTSGNLVPISELGEWKMVEGSQTIYHKNLHRIAYVFAECVGRAPAECVIDILADQKNEGIASVEDKAATPIATRTFLRNGSQIVWSVPEGTEVTFAGEGEWKITLDVFRDLGLAFGAAMLMIYIILVAQTGSFLVPVIVMLAIPLTALGVMPGFYFLNLLWSQEVGGYADPVYFTATAMIGMIALSGIVTRDSIILVDFMQQAVQMGRPLFDAILESRVVRLRPILLTAGAAMLSALPITLDPIFSGLGWSLIFGLIASTVFTLFVIPVTYWLLYRHTQARAQ